MRRILIWLLLMSAVVWGTTYSAKEAVAHVGEYAQVCGTISSGYYAKRSKGRPTFLNMEGDYPHQKFTIVIWGEERDKFHSPESRLKHEYICVRGLIEMYKGKPQIIVTGKGQLTKGKR